MKILVGCPVLRREWIISYWFDYVEAAVPDGVEVEYVFVVDPRDPTKTVIDRRVNGLQRQVHYVDVVDRVKEPGPEHGWAQPGALEKMVTLRNYLLGEVRQVQPDLFLSVDSDILLHPQQISNLVEVLETDERKFDAVGGKVYLSPGKDNPSWAYYNAERGLRRLDIGYVGPVDVIMALKLMTPQAYAVDYEYEKNGEDIGWSLACKDKGLKLGFDGRIASKHVMAKKGLNGDDLIRQIDKRCGF